MGDYTTVMQRNRLSKKKRANDESINGSVRKGKLFNFMMPEILWPKMARVEEH